MREEVVAVVTFGRHISQHCVDLEAKSARPMPNKVVMVAAESSATTTSMVACGNSSSEITRIAVDHADPMAQRAA